ncbi:hypothetical protein GCM10023143_18050 [Compostibacter hankyongensis]|uniref:Thioredoxin domain-containing protein n=2 Tax=Compostibacter hankyongensis TaxID=1007089 RepID=A0ABP8FS63_9BACT
MYLDDGKSQKLLKIVNNHKNTIDVSGTYYSNYAAIILRYPKTSYYNYQEIFFVKDKPAAITFSQSDSTESPFENYTLANAYDLKKGKNKIHEFDSTEVKKIEGYLTRFGDKIFDGSDTSLTHEFGQLNQNLFRKDLEYVTSNGQLYYSFFYFRRNIAPSYMITPDSALHLFNTVFPKRFKDSEEGNTILKILHGRMPLKNGNSAPVFSAKDINGKEISLADYRHKKYVLLTFWATWCGPCIDEIPDIKILHKKHSSDLMVISVAYQGPSYATYLSDIKKYHMDWINIYNNEDLINLYGGALPIPRIYLIDKSGIITYVYDSNATTKENPISVLEKLLSKK